MRFAFGRNWGQFLSEVDGEAIKHSERGLLEMLGGPLQGVRFLDVGSGSGLSSVAATNLGAEVRAFDFDPDSVVASATLRDRFSQAWSVEVGDVLDEGYIESLGRWDVVYSWGVLHHTGNMWAACDNAARLVAPGGRLFVAIYNDQGIQSRIWWLIKWAYNSSKILRPFALILTFFITWGLKSLRGLVSCRSPQSVWRDYKVSRGMSPWHDVVDWAGGFPYERATVEDVVAFYHQRGFAVERLRSVGNRLGCNEFVFVRSEDVRPQEAESR